MILNRDNRIFFLEPKKRAVNRIAQQSLVPGIFPGMLNRRLRLQRWIDQSTPNISEGNRNGIYEKRNERQRAFP